MCKTKYSDSRSVIKDGSLYIYKKRLLIGLFEYAYVNSEYSVISQGLG